jgi:hypothetical protein
MLLSVKVMHVRTYEQKCLNFSYSRSSRNYTLRVNKDIKNDNPVRKDAWACNPDIFMTNVALSLSLYRYP